MRRRSTKGARLDAAYRERRQVFMAQHRYCEIKWDTGCGKLATDIDHKVRRNHLTDDQFLDTELWQATCRYCHQQKELNLAEAYARGLAMHAWEIG